MCYHYDFSRELASLADQFAGLATSFDPGLVGTSFYPLSLVPVIRAGDAYELTAMEWGLLPRWWKPKPKQTSRKSFQRKCFNARSETAHEKPSFRDAYKHRRCLIPATRFEEKKHWFSLESGQTMYFAGLWERWEDEEETVESCTILTTRANRLLLEVGHDRMPVILPGGEEQNLWMDPEGPESGQFSELLEPLADDMLSSQPQAS